MPRAARIAPGGMVFHVLNRGVGRMELFSKEKDFEAFEGLLEEACQSRPMRICAYCLMPNHWHFLLWPERHGDLAAFMQQLTTKHVRRWQLHRGRVGDGHVYQGRYKSFPVDAGEYFYAVVRYGERNALRAAWSSGPRFGGGPVFGGGRQARQSKKQLLSDWLVPCPKDWCQFVNQPQTEAELEAIRRCVVRGQP